MTFEEFQATKKWSDDLGSDVPDYVYPVAEDGKPKSGWVYHGMLVIEAVTPWWPEKARAEGQWYLILGNLEWISEDLEELEMRLYHYAIDEQIA